MSKEDKVPCPVCGGTKKFIDPRTGKEVVCDWCDKDGMVNAK